MTCPPPFASRLGMPDRTQRFALDDAWVWCGSMLRGDDGRWQLFVSTWSKTLPFFDGYKVASRIVRAEAPAPEGPWTLAGPVLPERGEDAWDGRMTHNPVVVRRGGRWHLYYIGATYRGPQPTAAQLRAGWGDLLPTFRRIRIGYAWADAPAGPWHRSDQPCLDSRPGAWDDGVVTNPAPCVMPDGRLLLLYRGNLVDAGGAYRGSALGVALADAPGAPLRRLRDAPLFFGSLANRIEDPCVWWDGMRFQLIAKDLTGALVGRHGDGVHAWSANGADWRLAAPPRAWSRPLRWSDGAGDHDGSMERPNLVFQDGVPTHLTCAMGDGTGANGWRDMTRSWVQVLPLRQE